MGFDPQIIKSSFERARPIGNKMIAKFYKILFADYPDARGLFKNTDMEQQEKNLLKSLAFVVDHLENELRLKTYLGDLGKRHTGYGSAPEHYDWVGGSLLKTLAFYFKDEWTSELEHHWTEAFMAIKQLMLAGAAKAQEEQDAPPSKHANTNANLNEQREEETHRASTLHNESRSSFDQSTSKVVELSKSIATDAAPVVLSSEFLSMLRAEARSNVEAVIIQHYQAMVREELERLMGNQGEIKQLLKKAA